MLRLLLHWVLNAVALLIVSHFVVGFQVGSVVSALIAVIVIGLFNATLGLLLKIITLPLGILTFGIFFRLTTPSFSGSQAALCQVSPSQASKRPFLEHWHLLYFTCCLAFLVAPSRLASSLSIPPIKPGD